MGEGGRPRMTLASRLGRGAPPCLPPIDSPILVIFHPYNTPFTFYYKNHDLGWHIGNTAEPDCWLVTPWDNN